MFYVPIQTLPSMVVGLPYIANGDNSRRKAQTGGQRDAKGKPTSLVSDLLSPVSIAPICLTANGNYVAIFD